MKLSIVDIDINKTKPKATIHYSGKLGFNMEANEFMKLKNQDSYFLAKDDEKEGVLYLIKADDTKGVAKIAKAGNYYYLNVGDAFDKLKFDYKKSTIMFEISTTTYENKEIFVLTKYRDTKRKDKALTNKTGV